MEDKTSDSLSKDTKEKFPLDLAFQNPKKSRIVSKGIKLILTLLKALQVVHSTEVNYGNSCYHIKPLPFDVQVIIKGKVGLIEFDGIQHFQYGNAFCLTKEDLINQQTRDLIKTIFAKKNLISLLRISFDSSEKEIQNHLVHFLEGMNTQKEPIYIMSNLELYKEHQKIINKNV